MGGPEGLRSRRRAAERSRLPPQRDQWTPARTAHRRDTRLHPGTGGVGQCRLRTRTGEEHYNPIGSVHGGVYATLLDSAAGCAVQSVLPAGMGYTSLDLNLKFLRPITVDTGKVRAVGSVLNQGRRTALAQAELFDSNDRLLAHATSSCMLFPVPAA
ncbi:PaaI family thioesterase [Streptomyces sp. MBT84]|uniref:PaaI family thioesterase n=1 Tax=Streptomyces sp. MBT84 TaxID=1488414 RepID=UPI0027E1C960|nr:PaaI family thioesterase [Streptomyces sp. MBT84]